MKAKKQQNNPLIKKDENGIPYFVSPNRKTYRKFLAGGLETERVCGERRVNPNRAELRDYRKEVARAYGSTTGQLKKKHLHRQKLNEGHTHE